MCIRDRYSSATSKSTNCAQNYALVSLNLAVLIAVSARTIIVYNIATIMVEANTGLLRSSKGNS